MRLAAAHSSEETVLVADIMIDAADPRMEWNRWFSQLPSWGDYGTQKLFVFQKI